MVQALLEMLYRKKVPGRGKLFRMMGAEGFFLEMRGFDIYVNPFDYIDSHLINHGYYEPVVFDAIASNLGNGETFWDVGANIGLHSFAIKASNPTSKVLSFEPNPMTMSRLMRSKSRNGIAIMPLCLALSDRSQVAGISMKSQGNSGLSSLCPWEGTAYDDYCLVGTARADDLIHRGECVPNVVKIDVEGHEFNVLSGFGDFLAHPSLRMIVFEDNRSDDVHGLLGAAGFRVQRISSSESCAEKLV